MSTSNDSHSHGDEVNCCLCGYEPMDPEGIYSELFDAYMCADCEPVALRVLTTIAEAGRFKIAAIEFEVLRLRGN